MSAVQGTMHADPGYPPGSRTEAPWSWERLPGRPRLTAYLLTVIAADVALSGWQLAETRLRPGQLVLFATFLGCAAACVEATRRWGVPQPGPRDLLTAWWLPAALLLPPVCALAGPALIGGFAHWRASERVRVIAIPSLGAAATVTVSIGVAELGRDGNELFELLAAADAALYRAKQSGRDRVATLPLGACPSDPRHRCP